MFSLFLSFFACSRSSLPEGYWLLSGINTEGKGAIRIENQKINVELYTDNVTTGGSVSAHVEQQDELLWLFFPLKTGQGEGEAALRFQGNEAMLPLGARRGEFEVYFSAENNKEESLDVWKERSINNVEKEIAYWRQGDFLLKVDDNLLGVWSDHKLRVFDAHWLTPSPVTVIPQIEGADILLKFPIEPSFHNEDGLLRINIPLRKVSVPISQQVDPLDRAMEIVPGTVSQAEIDKKVQEAILTANQKEEAFVSDLIRDTFLSGSCEQLVTVDLNHQPIWKGYKLEWMLVSKDKCALSIEAMPNQHRRRLKRTFQKE